LKSAEVTSWQEDSINYAAITSSLDRS